MTWRQESSAHSVSLPTILNFGRAVDALEGREASWRDLDRSRCWVITSCMTLNNARFCMWDGVIWDSRIDLGPRGWSAALQRGL